jgi:hypothetical protein
MIKIIRTGAAVALTLLIAAGCSGSSKPTDPAKFAQKWLNAVVDTDSGKNCDIAVNWLSSDGRMRFGNTCDAVSRELQKELGVTDETSFSDCVLQNKDGIGQPGWSRVLCSKDASAEVLISGPKNDLQIEEARRP